MKLYQIPLPLFVAAVALLPSELYAQSLRGSRAKVERVHSHALTEGFDFHPTSRSITRAVEDGALVRLNGNSGYRVNAGVRWPYVQPAVKVFVERLGSQYRSACGEQLVVTSAVRPLNEQPWNASSQSVHPAGIAVDLRKPQGRCLTWLRSTLASLQSSGMIDATEEFRPPHFHVVVYPGPYGRYVAERTGSSIAAVTAGPTERYRVRSGDTLWGIARRHGVTVARLQSLNHMSTSTLRAGEQILVPVR